MQVTGQTYNYTVADCIAYAIQHQDSVLNAGLDVKSAGYRVKEISGQAYPQISGSASFIDYVKLPTTLLPGEFVGMPGTLIPVKFGVKYQSSLALAGTQTIFDGSVFIGIKAAKTYKELYERNYTRSRIDVTVNVTKAYYQVLVSNEQIKLLDANINQLKAQLDQTVKQNKQGFVEKIDVDRLRVQYNDLVTMRENTLRLLVLNYQLLKFQMGMPIETSLTLKDKLNDIQLDGNSAAMAASDTTIYHNRIEYSLVETQLKLNQFALLRSKAQYLPTLSANGSIVSSYQNNSFGNLYAGNFPSSFVGLTLNVPIFSGGQRLNQVRQSNITVQKTQNDLANLRNALSLQASQAQIVYINGLKTLENQKQSQTLANEVLHVAKVKYQQGVGSSIEVTQAETALEDADNKYIQGLYDALVSKVDLDRATGLIK